MWYIHIDVVGNFPASLKHYDTCTYHLHPNLVLTSLGRGSNGIGTPRHAGMTANFIQQILHYLLFFQMGLVLDTSLTVLKRGLPKKIVKQPYFSWYVLIIQES